MEDRRRLLDTFGENRGLTLDWAKGRWLANRMIQQVT